MLSFNNKCVFNSFLDFRCSNDQCIYLFRPVNILDGEKNALPTAACFGCCINYLFYILFLNDSSGNADAWLASKLCLCWSFSNETKYIMS